MKLIGFFLSFCAFLVDSFAIWLGYFAHSLKSRYPLYRRSTWRCATVISVISLLSLIFSIRFTALLPCSAFACLIPMLVFLPCRRLEQFRAEVPAVLAIACLVFLIILTICCPSLSEVSFSFSTAQTPALIFLVICAAIVLCSIFFLRTITFLIGPLVGVSSAAVMISLSLLARVFDEFQAERVVVVSLCVVASLVGHVYGLARFVMGLLSPLNFGAAFGIYGGVVVLYAVVVDPAFAGAGKWWAVCGWISYAGIVGAAIAIAYGLWPGPQGEPIGAERLLAEAGI
jgi:hypothetical protein